jgi:hypothetical protein
MDALVMSLKYQDEGHRWPSTLDIAEDMAASLLGRKPLRACWVRWTPRY